jgi:type I restriction enzyme R subunit
MSAVHAETNFESDFVAGLVVHGWLEDDAKGYDRALALFGDDVVGWLQETQKKEYEKLKTLHGSGTDRKICERVRKAVNDQGALYVLRNGFAAMPSTFSMCAFKPENSFNADLLERYAKVRCRVVRQVRYSLHGGESIDLVLFVNGIPVATLELKTDFTQPIENAKNQYKEDRLPKNPKTGHVEPLLTPIRGAVVHFAVSTDQVYMTTELAGDKTDFLPFNLGNDGAAGNPPNPAGYRVSYLWERVLQRDPFLDILGQFAHVETSENEVDGKAVKTSHLLFPRFHQWDVVTKLLRAAREEGLGRRYLIQHSAGSGKSNSIMWLAHRLHSLHDAADKRVFDTVVVVTDRNVLDKQLSDTIFQFTHEKGVVRTIRDGTKSKELLDALKAKTAIIVVTLQTFPFLGTALEDDVELRKLRYAIIADEAHSSQSGKAAQAIREMLGHADDEPDAETQVSAEDYLALQASRRAQPANISHFAFTATPKPKTLDLFGRKDSDGRPAPFHVYEMQQAIEEGFILDVLQNYTAYSVAYKLATKDEKSAGVVVPKSRAAMLISGYARLHDYNISQKVAVIVEHFQEQVRPLLAGRAKAMVVCDSRKAAVKYKRAMDAYIAGTPYRDLKTIVAFSGDVTDEAEWPGAVFNEPNMNGFPSGQIAKKFGTRDYQVLLVAEKFQTGFDQPLLCAMYVDKKLEGVNAVQTLSRLNRTYKRDGLEKTQTFVLDFVNDPEAVLDAFRQFYRTATLDAATDPDKIHDLRSRLDATGHYGNSEVDVYANAYIAALRTGKRSEGAQAALKAILDPIVERFRQFLAAAEERGDAETIEACDVFRKDMLSFTRAYGFLSQIYDYASTDLEKRAIFYDGFGRLVRDVHEKVPLDISAVTMTHYSMIKLHEGSLPLSGSENGVLKSPKDFGTAEAREDENVALADVLVVLNDLFGESITEENKIAFVSDTLEQAAQNDVLRAEAVNNSFERFRDAGGLDQYIKDAALEAREQRGELNDKQKADYDVMLERLLGDPDAFGNFLGGIRKKLYDDFNGASP